MNNKLLTKKITLNNGIEIPIFGVGTYELKPGLETYNSVKSALKLGIRHIDSAQYYRNEEDIVKAIKDSNILREEIFITSKIATNDHSYKNTSQQIDILLNKLQTSYLDLLLVHWPTSKWIECYQALIAALRSKKILAIGVSNFDVEHLKMLEQKFSLLPVVNQIEIHPGFNNQEVVNYCQKNNIAIESWGTMMRGQCQKNDLINQIAIEHHQTPFQVCLQWALSKNYIIFPKSVHPERIAENMLLEGWTLTKKEIQLLDNLPQKRIGPVPNEYVKNIKFNN